jgi:cytochrome c nitrite reductase small subunit
MGGVHAKAETLDSGGDCLKCHSRIAHGSNHLEGGIKVE